MSQIFIAPDYSYFQVKDCCMDYKWWWMTWKCINFIWPFTNGGYQYSHSGWCYNKLLIGMKTSVKWSSQHSKCAFIHTFFYDIKAAFLKRQSNFLHSPVPGLCYYSTWKLYLVFWEWFWSNWGAMAQWQGFHWTVQNSTLSWAGVNHFWSVHRAGFYFT